MPIFCLHIINLAEIAMHHIGRSNNNNRSINWHQSTIQSRLHNNSSFRHHHPRNEMIASPIKQVMTTNENNSLLSVPSYNVTVTQIDVTTTEEIMDFPPAPASNLCKFS